MPTESENIIASSATAEVVEADLNYICDHLRDELPGLSGKRLLVTGGAGFLGYYLLQSILHWNKLNPEREPIDLIVLDNHIRGLPGWFEDLRQRPNFTTLHHDIVQSVPEAVGDANFIIHAASIASPTFYRIHPIETMDTNVQGLRNLLEYACRQKDRGVPVEGFLFFSSSEVYGDPDPAAIPTPETYNGNVSFTGPRACYDESKRYGETVCVNFVRQRGLPVRIARPFNNFGPGLRLTDRRVIPDFAQDILAGRDLVLLSDGSATRTFCYIADAIVGYLKTLLRGRDGEAYNIGVEKPEISMGELAETMVALARELFGYEGKAVRQVSSDKEYLTDNPNRRCPVIRKAEQELAYHPEIELREGLRRSLLWYRDCAGGEKSS